MTIKLGLTGSIGMGKSTTAQMFRDLGIPVWDADAAVHALYEEGGAAVAAIGKICPYAIRDGRVDRSRLKSAIANDAALLPRIEAVVHPLVARDRQAFIARHSDHPMVVLDIPLLFETGGDGWVDHTLVVTTDPETQKARVMARPSMTEADLERLLDRQMPDDEKRKRADVVIRTDRMAQTRADIAALVASLTETKDA